MEAFGSNATLPRYLGVLTKYSQSDSESVCAWHGVINYARFALWIVWQQLHVQSHCLVRTHGWFSELSPSSCQRLHIISPWPCQCTVSTVRVCMYSHRDLVKSSSSHRPGHGRAHGQLSESAHTVAVIFSEASHAIALVLAELTFSCRSPQVYSQWSLSGLTVDFQNLDVCFTDCDSIVIFEPFTRGMNLVSFPSIAFQWQTIKQIYTIEMSSYTSSSSITMSGSHCVAAGAIRSGPEIAPILSLCILKSFFCISCGIHCHWSNGSLYVSTEMSHTCVQNGVLHTLVGISFKYHLGNTATSPVVKGMLYSHCSK